MATITPTVTRGGDGSVIIFSYVGLANGDDGAPIEIPEWFDRSVQVLGAFGTGGDVAWEASNDGGTTYAAQDNSAGNATTFTAAGIKHFSGPVGRARPRVTAGDGTTDIDVHVVCLRRTGMRT